jgi:hypothetical protein
MGTCSPVPDRESRGRFGGSGLKQRERECGVTLMVEAQRMCKRFGRNQVLKGIDLEVTL